METEGRRKSKRLTEKKITKTSELEIISRRRPSTKKAARSLMVERLVQEEHENINLPNLTQADEIREKLLEEERDYITTGAEIQENQNRLKVFKKKAKKREPNILFPVITRNNVNKLFSSLNKPKSLRKDQKELMNCLDHLRTQGKLTWTSPMYILKAVRHAVLSRKWSNLTHLLLFLIDLPSNRYKPLIRHLCQVMNSLHPTIQEHNLTDQLDIIRLANKR